MENKNNNILDMMNSMNEKLDTLINANLKEPSSNGSLLENKEKLNSFVINSRKDYVYLGSLATFKKEKLEFIIFEIIFVICGILSTIFLSIIEKVYSTFSFFENLYTISTLFMLFYAIYRKPVMADYMLKDFSNEKYELNKFKIFVKTGKEKLVYFIFRILAVLSSIATTIYMFTFESIKLVYVLCAIFEVSYLVFMFISLKKWKLFNMGYDSIVIFKSREIDIVKEETICYVSLLKQFITVEELKNKFKDNITL